MPKFSLEYLDNYVNDVEIPVAIASLAATGATLGVPNPVTSVIAAGANVTGGVIDLYQGIRAGMRGDWPNVAKNASELALSLIGAKAVNSLNKSAKLTKSGIVLSKDPRMLGIKVAPGAVKSTNKIVTGTTTGLGSVSSMYTLPQDNTRVETPYVEIRQQPNKRK